MDADDDEDELMVEEEPVDTLVDEVVDAVVDELIDAVVGVEVEAAADVIGELEDVNTLELA